MTIPGKKTQKISDTPQSKDEITKAMIKMIRTLVTLSQTMKALPGIKVFLSIRDKIPNYETSLL